MSTLVSRLIVQDPQRTHKVAVAVVGGLGLVAVYLGYSVQQPYHLDVTLLFIVYALLAIGMYAPVFLGGYIDLAYNAYFALGAYSIAIWSARTDQPVVWAVPLGCLVAGAAALILGLVTSRLSGFHLALATLVAGGALYRWIITTPDVTGGASGLGGIERPSLFGFTLEREGIVISGLVLIWVLAVAMANFRAGAVGLALRLGRESPAAARACGIPSRTIQTLSLVTGAAIASLAGAIFALMNQFVLAESFTVAIVFLVLFLPLVGGLSTPWGAVLGALIITAATQEGSFFDGPGALLFGVLTLLILIIFPSGILGFAASVTTALRTRLQARP